MAFNVYHNPKTVTIGSVVYGVTGVSWTVTQTEIHAAADDDTHESVARYATKSTRGTITFVDPEEAMDAAGINGTLSYILTDVKGSSDKTVTINNCTLGGYDANVVRDAASSATVPFIAETEPSIA